MEKHQLSTMIAGLSLLVAIISVIVPSVYAGDDEDNKKDLCQENEGDWKDDSCAFDDEDKEDKFSRDYADLRAFEEERAADEDALCDDPEDSEKFDVCQSATLAFASDDKDEDYSETEEWNEKDYEESKQDDDNKDKDKDNERYTFKSKQGDGEVTHYFKDKDDAEEAYENLDKDELTHSDKSYSDWEYDDEEHPALD
jgi:hypothetical protein